MFANKKPIVNPLLAHIYGTYIYIQIYTAHIFGKVEIPTPLIQMK